MIRYITGKTGGGKTSLAVAMLIDELRYTDRFIFTNMAVKMDPWIFKGKPMLGLLHILEREFGETYDAGRRIIFIGPDEIQRFYGLRARWDTRGDEPLVERLEVPHALSGLFVKNEKDFPGAAYFIDEAHEYFPQAEWQKIGKECQSWASQNRRAGDDAWLLTQEAELVAKPFRRQSLECYWMINHSYFALGPFNRPDVITYQLHMTTPPAEGTPPLRHGKIQYKKELLWHCYDTASAAGVHGGAADVGARRRGLPFWVLPVAIVGLGVLFLLGIKGCQTGVRKFVSAGQGRAARSAIPSTNAVDEQSTKVAPGQKDVGWQTAATERLAQVGSQSTKADPFEILRRARKPSDEDELAERKAIIGYGWVRGGGHSIVTVRFEDGTFFDATNLIETPLTYILDRSYEFPKASGKTENKGAKHKVEQKLKEK